MEQVRDFLLTDDGEWAVSNGDFQLVSDEEAVPQGIVVRVRTLLGEIYLDEAQGVDWLNQILIKNPDPLVVRALLAEAIGNTPDVLQVVGTEPTINPNRTAAIDYQVVTVYSTTPLLGTVTS